MIIIMNYNDSCHKHTSDSLLSLSCCFYNGVE